MSEKTIARLEQPLSSEIHYQTLGREAVRNFDEAVGFDFDAAQIEATITHADTLLQAKQLPTDVGFLKAKVGQVRGTIMTGHEADIVYRAANMRGEGSAFMKTAAERQYASADKELLTARQALTDLDDSANVYLNAYCLANLPSMFQHAKRKSNAASWSEWLSQKADDNQLRNFFQWHVDFVRQHQNQPEIAVKVSLEKERYGEAVQRGVDDNWLHPDALEAAEKVKSVKVDVGDVFDTLMQERAGYHFRGTDNVVVAGPVYRLAPSQKLDSLTDVLLAHEFNHAVLGRLGARWMDEALTEHIALVMNNQEGLETMGNNSKAAYFEERQLLDAVLYEGAHEIPVALATKAYSQPEGAVKASDALLNAIDAAWEHAMSENNRKTYSVLGVLANYIHQREHEIRQQNTSLSERFIQRTALRLTYDKLLNNPHAILGVDVVEQPIEDDPVAAT